MNVEGIAILRALDPERSHKFLRLGEAHFKVYQKEFEFIKDYVSRYGSVPPLQLFKDRFPRVFDETIDSYEISDEYVIDFLEDRRLHDIISNSINDVLFKLEIAKPRDAYTKLVDIVNRCMNNSVSGRIYYLREAIVDALNEYKDVKHGLIIGADFVLDGLNRVVGFIRPGEVYVLASRPGVGKTWFMLLNAYKVWSEGKRVLFISPEMSISAIARRFIAIHFGINHGLIRKANLDPAVEKQIFEFIDKFNDDRFVLLAEESVARFRDVESAIVDFKPDVVYVDGIYLIKPDYMRNVSNWEIMKEIADWVVNQSKIHSVPFIISTQLHRVYNSFEDVSIDDLAYSDAFAQNCDFVSYMYSLKKEEVKKIYGRFLNDALLEDYYFYRFRVLKSREGIANIDLIFGISFQDLTFIEVGPYDGTAEIPVVRRFGLESFDSEIYNYTLSVINEMKELNSIKNKDLF